MKSKDAKQSVARLNKKSAPGLKTPGEQASKAQTPKVHMQRLKDYLKKKGKK